MSTVSDHIAESLSRLEEQALLRRTVTVEEVDGPFIVIEGKRFLCFCTNDYLGLSRHPRLAEAAIAATREYGWGTGASRLLSGTTKWHQALEERIASFKQCDSAILFISGYMANMGLVTALADEKTLIAADQLNHASMIDGCRLSRATIKIYRHRDPTAAAEALATPGSFARKLLISDTVFSMDGDIAPLPELAKVAADCDAEMIVDEAHGFGIFGNHGRGVLEHFGLEGKVKIVSATLSKAAGSAGGFIAGSRELTAMLCNKARSFIFTTAHPPALCAAGIAGIDLIAEGDALRAKLWENVRIVRDELRRLEFDTRDSEAPIIPVVLGSNERALKAAAILREAAIFTPAIRPPTVPEGESRLRLSVTALHTREHLGQLLEAMKKVREISKERL